MPRLEQRLADGRAAVIHLVLDSARQHLAELIRHRLRHLIDFEGSGADEAVVDTQTQRRCRRCGTRRQRGKRCQREHDRDSAQRLQVRGAGPGQ
jgi:hypothetical protein